MQPIEFEHQNTVLGKDQPEYNPLPAHRTEDRESAVTSCWELSDADLEEITRTRRIYVTQLTFRHPLQPLLVQTEFTPAP